MKSTINLKNTPVTVDLSQPLDISIPLSGAKNNPVAWYLSTPVIQPVKQGDWVAKVSEGASVNFNNIQFNPHAHGTHTECVGHISEEFYSVNKILKQFFFLSEVISVTPQKQVEDSVITKNQLQQMLKNKTPEAVVIRTLPNLETKKHINYSHTNWAYLTESAALFLREKGINHLLIDTPSVDKEKDEGKLLAHKAFWNYPEAPRMQATITELIYVPEHIKDGSYLLNLMIAPFCNDASPSKPVLYKIG